MIPFVKKHFIHIVGGAFVVFVILVMLAVVLGSLNSARNLGSHSTGLVSNDMAMMEVSAPQAPAMGRAMMADGDFAESLEYYPEPIPTPGGYTSGLERYETTQYNLSARSRGFDQLCESLETLKAEETIHFKHINTGLNRCDARFFVEEGRVAGVLAQFENNRDVEINRNTESVTRHKERLESQSTIVRQQLASVERTLAEAEVAYDEIVAFARANKDSETLSNAINNKLRQIDQLTSRKINLTSQLDNLAQQAADLNERLDVVEFYASFTRANPIQIGKYDRMWEQAWDELRDRFTGTLIGLSAFFGVFLLYVLQYGLYLLVLIIVARFGWKLVRKIWRF